MKEKNIVTLNHVNLNYQSLEGETPALEDISFSVAKGEFIGIIGPSGCGKTTILSLIAGLMKPTSGTILVEGKEVNGPSGRQTCCQPSRSSVSVRPTTQPRTSVR